MEEKDKKEKIISKTEPMQYEHIKNLYDNLCAEIESLNKKIEEIASKTVTEEDRCKNGTNKLVLPPEVCGGLITLSISEKQAKKIEKTSKGKLRNGNIKYQTNKYVRSPVDEFRKGNLSAYQVDTPILPTMQEWEHLSNEAKKQKEIELRKVEVIVPVCKAVAVNVDKGKEYNDNKFIAYREKLEEMEKILIRKEIYNYLVPEEKQIHGGFSLDPYGSITLEASVPEYSRASLHFGRANETFSDAMKNVNKELERLGFTPYKLGEKPEDIVENYPYRLTKYAINLGLVNRDNYRGANNEAFKLKTYAQNQKGEIDELGIEIYIKEHSNLKDREIMYLAERAGFGEKFLLKIEDVLERRKDLIDIDKDKLQRMKNVKQNQLNLGKLGKDKLNLDELLKLQQVGKDKQTDFAQDVNNKIKRIDKGSLIKILTDEKGRFKDKDFKKILRYANEKSKVKALAIIEKARGQGVRGIRGNQEGYEKYFERYNIYEDILKPIAEDENNKDIIDEDAKAGRILDGLLREKAMQNQKSSQIGR